MKLDEYLLEKEQLDDTDKFLINAEHLATKERE